MTKDDPGSYKDFIDEYGYDPEDSNSKKVYSGVVKEYRSFCNLFDNGVIPDDVLDIS